MSEKVVGRLIEFYEKKEKKNNVVISELSTALRH